MPALRPPRRPSSPRARALVACRRGARRTRSSDALIPRSGLRITRAADYAVRAVVHLAGVTAGARLARYEIARAVSAPVVFAGHILQRLTEHGLVDSRRGRRGGFGLTEAGRQASLLDVLVAIDGPLALNDCLSPRSRCERAPACAAYRVWRQAQARVIQTLRGAHIEGLAADAARLAARRAD